MPGEFSVSLSNAELSDLIGLIYQSSLETDQWSSFLDEMCRRFPQIAIAIAGYDGAIGTSTFAQSGFNPEYVDLYQREFAFKNDTAPYQMSQPVGAIFTDLDVVDRSDYRQLDFYRNWLAPQGFGPASAVVLASNEGRFLALNAVYPHDGEAETRAALAYVLELLTPHIIRAMEIARMMKLSGALAKDLRSLFDAVVIPMMVADFSGRHLFSNAAGQRLLSRATLMSLDRNDRLILPSRSMTIEFQDTLRDVVANVGLGVMRIPQEAGDLALCISPFRPEMPSEGGLDATLFGNDERVAVFLGQRGDQEVNGALLQDVYDLTPGEADVCRCLLRGDPAAKIAVDRSRSERTVRNQIQMIFKKVGVNRQSDLVETVSIFRTISPMFEPQRPLS